MVIDLEFDPNECKFEICTIEMDPDVKELINHGLDVKHYLSQHLQGDCGYTDIDENTYNTEIIERFEKGENIR